MSTRAPVSVIVLACDEELNIAECLASVAGWASSLMVIDSGSSDRTREIAAALGAEVVTHQFETHAKQWNWVLQNLDIRTDWVLGLDADQRLTPELQEEISRFVGRNDDEARRIEGVYVRRRQIFRGQWIRHGGYYPKHLLKLFRRGRAWADDRDFVDHHFCVAGATMNLRHDLIEDNRKELDIATWIGKHTRYAALQALEEVSRVDEPPSLAATWRALRGSPDARTAWSKAIWRRFPLFVRPVAYFLYRYVFRLGFLDGREGFIFHFLQALWYRLLIDIHVHELRRSREVERP